MRGDPEVEAVAAGLGLPNGRLISWSKSGYHELFPCNVVLFNGSIADDAGRLMWWGDLDLTRDEAKLIELAKVLERRLHLLFEGDVHFLDPIPVEAAAAVIEADGSVRLTYRWGIERDATGRIVRPAPPEPDAVPAAGGGPDD